MSRCSKDQNKRILLVFDKKIINVKHFQSLVTMSEMVNDAQRCVRDTFAAPGRVLLDVTVLWADLSVLLSHFPQRY